MRIAYCEPNNCVSPTPFTRAKRVLQLGGDIIGKVGAVMLTVLGIKADEHQEVGRRLGDLDALLLNLLRQQRRRRLQLVLHLHLRDVGIGALLEGQRDRHRAGR